MRLAFVSVVAAGLLAFAGEAFAGPLEDGGAAYQRQDYAKAAQILRPLADKGVAKAQFYLGSMYLEGQGVSKNPQLGATWLRKAADQGQIDAESKLGAMYMEGQGVPEDYAEALSWSGKAADQGDANAQHTLGILYATGHGVEKDFVRAHMWFNLSAAGGNPLAVTDRQFIQAKMTPEQVAEAQHMALVFKPVDASQSPEPSAAGPKAANASHGETAPAGVAPVPAATPAPQKAANLPTPAEVPTAAHAPAGAEPAPVASGPKPAPAPSPSPKQMLEKAADLPLNPEPAAPSARPPM